MRAYLQDSLVIRNQGECLGRQGDGHELVVLRIVWNHSWGFPWLPLPSLLDQNQELVALLPVPDRPW